MGTEDRDIHRRRPVPKPATVVTKVAERMPSLAQVKALYLRDGWRCRFCGCRVVFNRARNAMRACLPGALPWGDAEGFHGAFFAMTASVDHVRPHSAGGDNAAENLVTACWSCQFGRGAYTLEELGLSDPRGRPPVVDGWDGLCRVLDHTRIIPMPQDDGNVAVPKIHARVRQVQRSNDVPASPHATAAGERSKSPFLTEAEFFARLENINPGAAPPLKAFLRSLADIGVFPEYQRTVLLRFSLSSGPFVSGGWVRTNGKVHVTDAYYYADKYGHGEIGQRYLDAVAAIAGGTVRRYDTGQRDVVASDGKSLSVASLLEDADGWKALVETYVHDLRIATAP
jgi:hypothetical protein